MYSQPSNFGWEKKQRYQHVASYLLVVDLSARNVSKVNRGELKIEIIKASKTSVQIERQSIRL